MSTSAMRKALNSLTLAMAACLALSAGACKVGDQMTLDSHGLERVVTIAPQTVPGSSAAQGKIENLHFEYEVRNLKVGPKSIENLTVEEAGIRTFLSSTDDQTDAAISDSSRYHGDCQNGQAPIGWLQTIQVRIRKAGDTGSGELLGQYSLQNQGGGDAGICGFFLDTVDSVNLAKYAPDFDLIIDASGDTPPASDLLIGGYLQLRGRF